MPTPLSTALFNDTAVVRRKMRWPNWLREPLVHFIVLGGLLFAFDHFLLESVDDPQTIMIGADVDKESRQVFKASRGRDPTKAELDALRQVWLDNEVLYREGLALQVDKGDDAIRQRIIFKALSVIDANVQLPPFDDKLLRKWFEIRRTQYDEPARYDFEEAVLAGDATEVTVRAFVKSLNAGAPAEAEAGLRVFKGRPQANLTESYGLEFAKMLGESPTGEWRAYSTREGWRAIRLDLMTPSKPAVFERLRGVVLQDWTDATMAEQRTAAVRALAKKYNVKTETATK